MKKGLLIFLIFVVGLIAFILVAQKTNAPTTTNNPSAPNNSGANSY